MNQFIEYIANHHTTCYFISPHLDDAVFSAGGLIRLLSEQTSVTVINVFTKGGEKPYTLSTRAFLRQCRYTSFSKLLEDRIQEDKYVLSSIRVKVVNLKHEDALVRKKQYRSPFFTIIAQILPEVIHRYPLYRIHTISGKVSTDDNELQNTLTKQLTKLIDTSKPHIIFCPIGIGKHVDHVIVRDVCTKAFANVIYWADYPYNIRDEIDPMFAKQQNISLLGINYQVLSKKELILGYKSQIKPVFPDGKIPLVPEYFYMKESKAQSQYIFHI